MATKICGKCGRENPSNAVFCNYCGEKLNIVEEMKVEKNIRENKKDEIYSSKVEGNKIKKIGLGVLILFFIVAMVYCVNNRDNIGADTKLETSRNIEGKEIDIFNYAISKTTIKKDDVISTMIYDDETKETLTITVDDVFDDFDDSSKINCMGTLHRILSYSCKEFAYRLNDQWGTYKIDKNFYSNCNELIIKTSEHEYSFRDDERCYFDGQICNEKYGDMSNGEVTLLRYIFSNASINEDMINKVEFVTDDVNKSINLVVDVNDDFDNLNDKFKYLYMIHNYYYSASSGAYIKTDSESIGESYDGLGARRPLYKITIKTTNHQYVIRMNGDKYYLDIKYFLDNNEYSLQNSYSFNKEEAVNNMISAGIMVSNNNIEDKIRGEQIELGIATKIEKNQTETETKSINPKSQISISTSASKSHSAGTDKLSIYVYNDSDKDISYIKINLYEKKNGKIIHSDWTNDASVIKAGAKQTIEKYITYETNDSELEAEIEEVTFK